MVVNNWYVIMDACAIVVGEVTRIYFISYYILVVWIFLNLVIAFLIEQFLSSYENKLGIKEMKVDAELLRLKHNFEGESFSSFLFLQISYLLIAEKGYKAVILENFDTIQEDTLGGL